MNIPISRTTFTEQDSAALLEPLASGWVVQGPKVREFEEKWSAFTGAKHSVAVSNCTTALHLCLVALGVEHGDEVIVPAFTWVATANVVEAAGAKPVFCDIDPKTFNLDTKQLASLVGKKTRAIVPVHLFGLAADMDAVREIAERRNIFVVEDAACGFGSRYKGKHVGLFGHAGCFSFHPRKAITTGEGGMITTMNDELAAKLRSMRDHGASMSDLQRHLGSRPYLLPEFPYLGFNYRMTDLQGAIGSTQMDRAQDIAAARAKWANRYDELLKEIDWLHAPVRPSEDGVHGFQAYVCLFGKNPTIKNVRTLNERRNGFMDYLQQKGISTRPGTHAVHMLAYYREKYKISSEDYPNSMLADQLSIALPLFPSLTEQEFQFVATAVRGFGDHLRKKFG